jgi:AraC-like DNA-binding protein
MDWSPGYREIAPPAWLRGVLSCLWVGVVDPDGPPGTTLVLPDAATDLIWQQGASAFLAGPDTGPAPSTSAPGSVLVGARFLPGAGGPVLGLPLTEVLDRRVDAAEIPALRGRMPAAAMPAQSAVRALARLIADLAQQRPADPAMTRAAHLLGRPGRAEDVATALDLSERQFRRRCQASVGYGPRTLQRVLRFRRFVSAIDAGPLPDGLAGAAAVAGYADQPHLTRECVRLSGLTPQALVRERHAAPTVEPPAGVAQPRVA